MEIDCLLLVIDIQAEIGTGREWMILVGQRKIELEQQVEIGVELVGARHGQLDLVFFFGGQSDSDFKGVLLSVDVSKESHNQREIITIKDLRVHGSVEPSGKGERQSQINIELVGKQMSGQRVVDILERNFHGLIEGFCSLPLQHGSGRSGKVLAGRIGAKNGQQQQLILVLDNLQFTEKVAIGGIQRKNQTRGNG